MVSERNETNSWKASGRAGGMRSKRPVMRSAVSSGGGWEEFNPEVSKRNDWVSLFI